MAGTHYSDLIAWQRAMDLVQAVYAATKQLPSEERFGLTLQVRRAAASIPANIAEGQGRKISNVFRNHLTIALGSLAETETYILLVGRLGYAKPGDVDELLQRSAEVGRLLTGLIRPLRTGT
jgi:four helix bundle protein